MDKFLAESRRRERRVGDEPGEIAFGGGNRMGKRAQHDRDIAQRRCLGAPAVSGDAEGPFAETNDDDIVLHDEEAAKAIIAVNADLDRAMRLLNQRVDQTETLLPPGQKAFGRGALVLGSCPRRSSAGA